MTLPRREVIDGLRQELAEFEALLRSMDDAGWGKASRCEGWTTGDVAAHVVGTMTEVAEGRAGELGHSGKVQELVDARRGRSAEEVADELAATRAAVDKLFAGIDDDLWATAAPADVTPSIGDGIEALWYDAYVHAQDIRDALGLDAVRGPGLRASVAHLAALLERDGWGPAVIAVDGIEEFAVGPPNEMRVTGDPLEFVLIATGRADPASLGLDATVNVYRPR